VHSTSFAHYRRRCPHPRSARSAARPAHPRRRADNALARMSQALPIARVPAVSCLTGAVTVAAGTDERAAASPPGTGRFGSYGQL